MRNLYIMLWLSWYTTHGQSLKLYVLPFLSLGLKYPLTCVVFWLLLYVMLPYSYFSYLNPDLLPKVFPRTLSSFLSLSLRVRTFLKTSNSPSIGLPKPSSSLSYFLPSHQTNTLAIRYLLLFRPLIPWRRRSVLCFDLFVR